MKFERRFKPEVVSGMRFQKRHAPERVCRAREMRQSSTDAERAMWGLLRRENLGIKFRREHAIKGYFLDFYATEIRLAIECDGSPHFTPEGVAYDQARTAELNALGIEVLRFENNMVITNTPTVEAQIRSKIAELRTPLPDPLPEG